MTAQQVLSTEERKRKLEELKRIEKQMSNLQEDMNTVKKTLNTYTGGTEHSLGKRKLPPRNRRASIHEDYATGPELDAIANGSIKDSNNTFDAIEPRMTRKRSVEVHNNDNTFCGFDQSYQDSQKLLSQIRRHKYAWPFNQPVEPVELNIPDYFTIITHPMDLSTVETKLLNEEYNSADEFAADMRLIWSNAKVFNSPNHEVYKAADNLAAIFEKKMSHVHTGSNRRQKLSTSSSSLASSPQLTESASTAQMNEDIKELYKTMMEVKEEIATLQQDTQSNMDSAFPEAPLPPKRPRGRPRKVCSPTQEQPQHHHQVKPLTYEEKTELATLINALAPDNLVKVIVLLQKSNPTLLDQSADEIELDIEKLETSVQRKLADLVKKSYAEQQRASRKAEGTTSPPQISPPTELSESQPSEDVLPNIVQDEPDLSDDETDAPKGSTTSTHTTGSSKSTESGKVPPKLEDLIS